MQSLLFVTIEIKIKAFKGKQVYTVKTKQSHPKHFPKPNQKVKYFRTY